MMLMQHGSPSEDSQGLGCGDQVQKLPGAESSRSVIQKLPRILKVWGLGVLGVRASGWFKV